MRAIIFSILVLFSVNAQSNDFQFGASTILSDYDAEYEGSYKINVAYLFDDNFSVEASYIKLGTNSDGDGNEEFDAKGIAIMGIYKYPINDFALYAKLGALKWKEEGFYNIWWETELPKRKVPAKDNGTDAIYGVGISYSLTNNIAVKFEIDETDFNAGTLLIGLGFDISF